MELCVKCFFDNKSDFEKALNYLKPIVGNDMARTGNDCEHKDYDGYYIETYRPISKAQLDELTALCPIRRKMTKQQIISKIAFGIGRLEGSYHPEDDLDEETWNACQSLGLDPCAITLDLMVEFGIIPEHLK